jgi:hypothetical protein
VEQTAKKEIKDLILNTIQKKLVQYKQETEYKPFFEALFDKKTIINGAILQSLYTTFGMSIYEQIAIILAKAAGYETQRQYKLLGSIDKETELLILDIFNSPRKNKIIEIEEIREKIKPSVSLDADNDRVVDVYIKKPNKSEFEAIRKKILRWVGLRLSQDKKVTVGTYIGIPYNPYFPEDYNRWTGEKCHKEEVLVQNDLWNMFAGYDVFDELIEIFKEVGREIKSEVEEFISNK